MNKYYKDHYDVIIVGGALAGLSAALRLTKSGLDVLVLEQHNLPGGVATSFVRKGVEFEASLHEMCCVGSKEHPMKIRRLFDEYGIDVDWVNIPHAYTYRSNKLNISIRAGKDGDFTIPAKDIADYFNDKDGSLFNKIMEFFKLCSYVHDTAEEVSAHSVSKVKMVMKYPNFVKILGYSFDEVIKTFKFPKEVEEVLSAYWIYIGSPTNDISFLVFAYIITEYLGYGPHIPHHTSYEMSLKMAEKAEEMGAQIEYGQRVDKILIKDKKAVGVKLESGIIINSDYVLCGVYPNTVFTKMIEPKEAVDQTMIQKINSFEMGLSCFSLVMLLDKDYEELNIKDYATFVSPLGKSSEEIFESSKKFEKWNYYVSVCMNVVLPDASPKGTSVYSITFLPLGKTFSDMNVEEYEEYKRLNIEHFLELESERLGVNLKEHILELDIETPITISHYTSAYLGTIYGYRQSVDASTQVRQQMNNEHYFDNFDFIGASRANGDGMAPVIFSGDEAALELLKQRGKK